MNKFKACTDMTKSKACTDMTKSKACIGMNKSKAWTDMTKSKPCTDIDRSKASTKIDKSKVCILTRISYHQKNKSTNFYTIYFVRFDSLIIYEEKIVDGNSFPKEKK